MELLPGIYGRVEQRETRIKISSFIVFKFLLAWQYLGHRRKRRAPCWFCSRRLRQPGKKERTKERQEEKKMMNALLVQQEHTTTFRRFLIVHWSISCASFPVRPSPQTQLWIGVERRRRSRSSSCSKETFGTFAPQTEEEERSARDFFLHAQQLHCTTTTTTLHSAVISLIAARSD